MNFIPPDIDAYAEDHTKRGPSYLEALTRETWQKVVMPRMLSGHLQGRFLSMVASLVRPRRILEIGTYTGYSALCLAEGLVPGGELITIDINDELQWMHRKYIDGSPYAGQIRCMYGDARTIVPTLDPSFDLVFMDADKESYPEYYEWLVPRLPKGSLILIDNVLWSGKVLHEAAPADEETAALQRLNERIVSDERVENVLLPLRDGLMMVRVTRT